jgi:hypothetical protein
LGAELIGWGALKQQRTAALSRMKEKEKTCPCPSKYMSSVALNVNED